MQILHGIPVSVDSSARPDIPVAAVLERAARVLALVDRWQPWRLAHLRRDLRGIVVQRFPCRGAYFPGERLCLLELTFMVNDAFSDAQVAATLVHEGMHARLDRTLSRWGTRAAMEDSPRHERICRRAELEWGLAVPDGGPVIERALAAMQLADDEVAPAIDWALAERRIREADAR